MATAPKPAPKVVKKVTPQKVTTVKVKKVVESKIPGFKSSAKPAGVKPNSKVVRGSLRKPEDDEVLSTVLKMSAENAARIKSNLAKEKSPYIPRSTNGKSKRIPEEVWTDMTKRLTTGSTMTALAKEYGIPATTISAKLGKRVESIRAAAARASKLYMATEIVRGEDNNSLTSLTEELKIISTNLASAARHGAQVANKTAKLANFTAKLLAETEEVGENMKHLRTIAAYMAVSNEAAKTALTLVAANKEAVTKLSEEIATFADVGQLDAVSASHTYQRLMDTTKGS